MISVAAFSALAGLILGHRLHALGLLLATAVLAGATAVSVGSDMATGLQGALLAAGAFQLAAFAGMTMRHGWRRRRAKQPPFRSARGWAA